MLDLYKYDKYLLYKYNYLVAFHRTFPKDFGFESQFILLHDCLRLLQTVPLGRAGYPL